MRQVILFASLLTAPLTAAQFAVPKINKPEHPQVELQPLPDTRPPDAAALKAEYAKCQADIAEILKLAQEAKAAFDKASPTSLPADAVKMLGEIEKRAKQARRRFK